jgi:hypothetical protein
MKKIILFIGTFILLINLNAQDAAWIEPGPAADVTSEIKLYVDVSHPDCECPNLLNSDEPMYLWTWVPGDPPSGNGAWDASNPSLEWVQEGPNLYSFAMIPIDFYGVEAPVVYTDGISFLIKKFNGSDVDGTGENKSKDFHIDIEPVGCVNTLCAFPEVFQEDDYLTMIYNNKKELHGQLQDIEPDDCWMLPVAVAGGMEYPYHNGPVSDPAILDRPELHMKYEDNGRFYSTILSDDFFRIYSDNPVPDGVPIESIKVRYRKTIFTGNVSQFYELIFQCD